MKRYAFSALVLVVLAVAVYSYRDSIRFRVAELSKQPVPTEVPRPTPTPKPSPGKPTPTPAPIPGAINLSVPFISQAPFGVWDADHEDFCEEAAALTAASYVSGDKTVTDPAVAESRLQAIKSWEMATFGYFKDTTTAETARILTEMLKTSPVQVVQNPTLDQLRKFIAAGRVVIVPSAGRMLGNPYFTAPGPIYHMIVLKGYMQNGNFIVNDPGTRHGANYVYTADTIMNAMHDWNGGDVEHGAKVVIVVG